uniref:Uncharacterized protein n=1 Tax=Vitrella brassicaformis TaxID=1169539 RepID=A0A7S1JN57_9ALVE|mmetsp:Transcript_15284/g.36362  ORF Transcript_15284/g.36362 Transcript_15284/m.36362 type:complete len:103 (+) Transcript_15284:196-504(+)
MSGRGQPYDKAICLMLEPFSLSGCLASFSHVSSLRERIGCCELTACGHPVSSLLVGVAAVRVWEVVSAVCLHSFIQATYAFIHCGHRCDMSFSCVSMYCVSH